MDEIGFLESQLLASNKIKVESIVESIVRAGMENCDYFGT
jgi:hypothetical protein